ncbi:uncharacterized protein G2W53_020048 [Senna tora]|uniref:Uncharacterized protein n=1 Tax=Senna tora TaxID=362788 RepID=A0A834U2T6_9FABA|nr:uncharacterized protein G2W53_020048 [Senna tora]
MAISASDGKEKEQPARSLA